MKKIISVFLSLIFCFSVVGCSENGDSNKKNTLMIYMIGSDLEAKGGAGTNDLEEIKSSGIDVSKTNVIIYAGGSKRWHNNDVSEKEENTILKLTEKGFEKIKTSPSSSMGESECLSEFLNYSYKNYSADKYSLILWNHGNGPLIGYGKDMLFDNDSLTLEEMHTAFENSPFKGDKKLEWVGFDACLMSSAELVCVLDEYAKYLVASQEVEPAFGWNYDIFEKINSQDTKTFLKNLTEQYLISCEEYYKEREYEPQDTTLALIDLSKAQKLENSIENLFKKATNDVNENYNTLTASRVNTRALGRATTGSEYDLIDLYDMAEQLGEFYPDEAKEIQSIIEEMVLKNSTNAEKCCGISIYYPFYNKKYYENSWGEAYEKIGVLNEYANYLKKYDDIWLKNDLLQTVAKSTIPQSKINNQYSLELSAEQSKNFANASYYILQREGDQIYTRIFSSKKVTKQGNNLIADFDGNILYAKNKFDEYWIPVTVEHDTVGKNTRYSVYVNLTNETESFIDNPDDYEHKVLGHRFHLTANNETKKISKSALVPYNIDVDTGTLISGKQEEADLSEWTKYYFLQERHRYLKRDEQGTIKSFDEWEASDYLSANVSKIGDGVEFLFAPIPDGEYFIMFEIEDTQSNKYCSELLPIITTGNDIEKNFVQETIEIDWKSGEKVKLFEKENVIAYLTTITDYTEEIRYAITVENKNDFDIFVDGNGLVYNDEVFCYDSFFAYFKADANSTATEEFGFDFGSAQELGVINDLDSLRFSISVENFRGDKTIIYNQEIIVNLSEETTFIPATGEWIPGDYDYDKPSRDILAHEQQIFEKDGLKCNVVGIGSNGEDSDITLGFCFENTTDQQKYVSVEGIIFDDVYIDLGEATITVIPGKKIYYKTDLLEDTLNENMITSPSSATILFKFSKFATLEGGGGFSTTLACPINLASKGSGLDFKEGSITLYNKNGVKIALKESIPPEYEDAPVSWIMTITNNSGQAISLDAENIIANGQKLDSDEISFDSGAFSAAGDCENGKKSIFELHYYPQDDKEIELEFTPVFYDITEEKVLWTAEESVKLNLTIE